MLWLAMTDEPRADTGQVERSWVAGYLEDGHQFSQFAWLRLEGLTGIQLWLPRPSAPGSGVIVLHVRPTNSPVDVATAELPVAALAARGPTSFRFSAVRADPLRGDQAVPTMLTLETRGVERASAVSVMAGRNNYSNGLLVRDGQQLPLADLAFESLYAASWLDRLLPITRIAQRRPGIFGWPPFYALLFWFVLLGYAGVLVNLARGLRCWGPAAATPIRNETSD
jgi:hypothetical protein